MAPPWWGTLLYVPLLYGIGWVVSRPLLLLDPACGSTRWIWWGW